MSEPVFSWIHLSSLSLTSVILMSIEWGHALDLIHFRTDNLALLGQCGSLLVMRFRDHSTKLCEKRQALETLCTKLLVSAKLIAVSTCCH